MGIFMISTKISEKNTLWYDTSMEIPEHFPDIAVRPKSTPWRFFFVLVGIAFFVGGSFFAIGRPPRDFVPGTIIRIASGTSVKSAGDTLVDQNIIQSSSIFQFIVTMVFRDRPIIAGDFAFEKPIDVLQVAKILTGGSFGKAQLKITFPEGISATEMAAIIEKQIPGWDRTGFIKIAKRNEGYLFPDTYLVFQSITPTDFLDRLQKQYQSKMKSLESDLKKSKYSELQIITMASLLEKEARNADEAKIVSGILWKRLEKGMPLQVDAPFLYTLGKTSAQLSMADLQKDSPYNTYTRKGLPVAPIGNPGLAMITAALQPESSPYWYYLHDKNGKIYYAKTYEEHLQNKRKYLK